MELVFFFRYFTRHKQGHQIPNRAGSGLMHLGPPADIVLIILPLKPTHNTHKPFFFIILE